MEQNNVNCKLLTVTLYISNYFFIKVPLIYDKLIHFAYCVCIWSAKWLWALRNTENKKKYIYNSKKEEINSICINFNRYRTKKQIHQSKSKILPNIGQYKTKIYLLYKTIIFDFVFCMQRILQIFKVCIPFLTV